MLTVCLLNFRLPEDVVDLVMQAPDPAFEKMVLLDVVEQMKNPEDSLRSRVGNFGVV